MKKEIEVKCPKCEKKFSYYTSAFRPFCSERCKMIDLGHWLSEEYAIPEVKKASDEVDSQVTNTDDENED